MPSILMYRVLRGNRAAHDSPAAPTGNRFTDDFTGSPGQLLEARSGWSKFGAGTATAPISADGQNLGFASGTTSRWRPTVQPVGNDQEVSFTWLNNAAGQTQVFLRRTGDNDLITMRLSDLRVSELVGGVSTTLGTPTGVIVGDVITFRVVGSTISVLRNGAPAGGAFASAVNASGQLGIISSGTALDALLGDWSSGDVGA